MNKYKYLLLLFILFLVPNVYADEFNMNQYTSAIKNGTKNRYQGTEIYNTGGNFTYTFGTRYNGRLSEIETYFSYPFEKNTTYRFTYNMETNDFNNNFGSSYWWDCEHDSTSTVFTPTYISYKKIQYSITPTENTTCLRVSVRGKNLTTGNITQISNWNLSNITLYDPDYQSGSGGGQGTTPSTPDPNQTIIENQNNNTQDIINNNNENTNSIIENNNENTESINNTIKEVNDSYCKNGPISYDVNTYNYVNGYIDSDGLVKDSLSYKASPFFQIKSETDYTLRVGPGRTGVYVCFYNGNKQVNTCYDYNNRGTFTIKSPSGSNLFMRVTAISSVGVLVPVEITGPICNNWELEKQNDLTNGINNLNDTMKDESVPYIEVDFDVASDTPISDLLLMPLNLLDKIQVSLDYSCQPYVLPFDFFGGNNTLNLPCINLEDYLGSNVYNTLDYILCFFIAYQIGLMCVSIYNSITSLDDGFNALYEPKHGPGSYTPKHGGDN